MMSPQAMYRDVESQAAKESLLSRDALAGEIEKRPTVDEHDQERGSVSASSEKSYNLGRSLAGQWEVMRGRPVLTCMLITVPLGLMAGGMEWGPVSTFWFNFFAIVPLSWLLGQATEDLSAHTSEVIGGLLNVTFGNAVEVIMCFVALQHQEITVVQATLMGSMLSNVLFVVGVCFIWGGLSASEQKFSSKSTVMIGGMLMVAVMCLLLPTFFHNMVTQDVTALKGVSHGTSIFMLVLYFQFVYFQMHSHKHYFISEDEDGDAAVGPMFAVMMLALTTILTSMCSDHLVGAINGVVQNWDISKQFIGLVLLPFVGNAPEMYITASFAAKNKVDLALQVAVGSACQMMMFVAPLTVVFGWAVGTPMTLDFQPFQAIVVLISVLVVMALVVHGYSNWMQGSMLLISYLIIGMIYWYNPLSMESLAGNVAAPVAPAPKV